MGITTPIVFSSDIKKQDGLRAQDRVIDINKAVGADHYVNPIGGQELYDKQSFLDKGLKLSFIKTGTIVYPQFEYDFVSNLSIIDVLMFNSPQDVNRMLDNYESI